MIAYLSADLIGSTKFWSPPQIEAFAHELAGSFVGKARVTDMALSQGDSFQFEAHAREALSVALYVDALARRDGRPGMRVAFAIQEAESNADLPISVRSGPAYLAAGRGIVELKRRRQRLGYFGAASSEGGWTTACMLCGTLADAHSEHQSEILAQLLREPELRQATIAERLGITQQAVSKHYLAARIEAILTAESEFREHVSSMET